MVIPIGALIGIGLICGLIIYMVYIKVPQKVKGLEKTERINSILPGANCGACGKPGCFAYAQALTEDGELMTKSPCTQMLQDAEGLEKLEDVLGVTLDTAAMAKRAVIHCGGGSEAIYQYSGVESCKAASQLLSGYKRCPYACLGLGDCAQVCPVDAIFIDPVKKIAVVDPDKCTGCGLCVTECPKNIIDLVPADTKVVCMCSYQSLRSIPGRERCEFACTHCRKCFLACEYGAIEWDKMKAFPQIINDKCTLCRKCIEVCESDTRIDITKMGRSAEALPTD